MEQQNFQLDAQMLNDSLEKVMLSIPKIDSTSDYWLVRAKSGKFYTDFNINSYVGIGWNEISLEDIKSANNSQETMKNILKRKLTNNENRSNSDEKIIEEIEISDEDVNIEGSLPENTYGTWAGQLLRFVNNLKINDIVIVPSARSELLLVGKISGALCELSDKEIEESKSTETANYDKSDFKKRWPVKWIGYFNRNDADSKLYRMIYSQATLSNANEYKPYINRAIFPYYLEDNQLHLTLEVTQPTDVDSLDLGQLIYQYSLMSHTLYPENKTIVKVNVQSEGIVEIISEFAKNGLIIFGILSSVLVTTYGGKMKIFGQTLEFPGLIKGYQDSKRQKTEIDSAEIDNIKKAYDLAKELKVPISKLGVKIPKELATTLDKTLEEALKEKKDTSNKDESINEN